MNKLENIMNEYGQVSRTSNLIIPDALQKFIDDSGVSYVEFVIYENKGDDNFVEIYRDPNRLLIGGILQIDFEKGYKIDSKTEKQLIFIAEFPKIKTYISMHDQSLIDPNNLSIHSIILENGSNININSTLSDEIEQVNLD